MGDKSQTSECEQVFVDRGFAAVGAAAQGTRPAAPASPAALTTHMDYGFMTMFEYM